MRSLLAVWPRIGDGLGFWKGDSDAFYFYTNNCLIFFTSVSSAENALVLSAPCSNSTLTHSSWLRHDAMDSGVNPSAVVLSTCA